MASSIDDPPLPPEIERYVFELTAFFYPKSVPTLLLVARRVKIWIEPQLFRVLSLYGPGRAGKMANPQLFQYPILSHLLDSRPASFFHDNVRNLQFTAAQNANVLSRFLSLCDATVNLDATCRREGSTIRPLLASLKLQHLHTVVGNLFNGSSNIDFSDPLFSNISHLASHDWTGFRAERWSGIAEMSKLTHLSFRNNYAPNSFCHDILVQCKSLKVLVIVCSSRAHLDEEINDRASLAAEGDPRLVVLLLLDDDSATDWQTGARGGEDYWRRAEAFVEKRRQSGNREGYVLS
ncbi:hypothetical protein B0H19DRAFT_1097325 [Mycena capillaripes]|nr:hypothetical protein B0H19DRAFT_1097325 [Mycena capillaripes]